MISLLKQYKRLLAWMISGLVDCPPTILGKTRPKTSNRL